MRKFFLSILLFTASVNLAHAEGESKVPELVKNSYDRNSISVVVVDRGDKYDDMINDAVRNITYGDKFDKNYITADRLLLDKVRAEESFSTEIDEIVRNSQLGHSIIKYWFDSDNNSFMDGELVEQRGRFNASDEDVMTAQTAKIGENALMDAGYALIKNSYVIVLDCCQIEDKVITTIDEDGNERKEAAKVVHILAYLYRINFPDEMQYQFYESCWIDETTPLEQIEGRKAAFNAMKIGLTPIATTETYVTRTVKDGGAAAAVESSYGALVDSFEEQVDEWQITAAIKDVKPLRAKIGTKEEVKNTDRFQAYVTIRKERDGEMVDFSRKVGYVRATKVCDNNSNATGNSEMTEFYQISNVRNIAEGDLLKQSNDLGMGLSVGYNVGGLSKFDVQLDYLLNMKTGGGARYMMLELGYDMMPAKMFDDDVIHALYGDFFDSGVSFLNIGLGYGFGIRATRFIEIVPSIVVGGDMMNINSDWDDGDDEEEKAKEWVAFYGKLGAKANFTVAYPLQLVAGVSYSMIASEGEFYSYYNNEFKACEELGLGDGIKERKGGFAISFGVKYTF